MRYARVVLGAAFAVIAAVGAQQEAIHSPVEALAPPPARPALAPTAGEPAPQAVADAPLVCIDPGHSLIRPNIVEKVSVTGPDGDPQEVSLAEVDINLDVAQAVVTALRERFGDDAVMMTWGEVDGRPRHWNAFLGPTGDDKPAVMARSAFCVAHGARAVVSIHTNWFPDAPNGTLIGYRDANDRALAAAVLPRLFERLRSDPDGAPITGFHEYGLDQGEWFLALGIADDDVPLVILEPVLMSDADEARRLLPSIAASPEGRRAQIAAAISEALGDWIASTLRPAAATP